ncbi:MAG: hypothetical protein JW969_00030 [Spirochaetales bacterium]|nr:hypothetical protein [Spirochaetales bacterium]
MNRYGLIYTISLIIMISSLLLIFSGCDDFDLSDPLAGINTPGPTHGGTGTSPPSTPTPTPDPFLVLRDGPNGSGSILDSASVIKGLTVINVYAALYDWQGFYIADVPVSWAATGNVSGDITSQLSVTTGTNTSFTALQTEENVIITVYDPTYGSMATGPFLIDNNIYILESLAINNYGSYEGFKAGGDWQVNGGQSSLNGSYALIRYAWPDVSGLPGGVVSAKIWIYKDSDPPYTAWTQNYAVYPMTGSWAASNHYGVNQWVTRPSHNQGAMKGAYALSGTHAGWFQVDITTYYNTEWFGAGFYGFALYSDAPWPSNSFHTICGPGYTDPLKRPYLEIQKGGHTVKFLFVEN